MMIRELPFAKVSKLRLCFMLLSILLILIYCTQTDRVWGPGKHVPLHSQDFPSIAELQYTCDMLISKAYEIIVTELDFERIWHAT